MLNNDFFDRDACEVAKDLIGTVIMHRVASTWLAAKIIETEAYYLTDKASHASLGFTEKRKALFMPAGTIYMYYARGGDSLNVSCHGDGNAVLIKSGVPYLSMVNRETMLKQMHQRNPHPRQGHRDVMKLCAGQTLLCKALGLKVTRWDQQCFKEGQLVIKAVAYQPDNIVQTTRLGIPAGRDAHLPYRFVDAAFARYCSKPFRAITHSPT